MSPHRAQAHPLPIDSALKERDKLLYAICAQSSDGIHVVDIATRKTIMANIALCQMLGYEPDEMMSFTMDDLLAPGSFETGLESFRKLASREISIARDLQLARKDGSVIYTDVAAAPVPLGGRQYMMGIYRDVSDSHQVRQALEVSYRVLEMANRHTKLQPLLDEFIKDLARMTDCESVGILLISPDGSVTRHASCGKSLKLFKTGNDLSATAETHPWFKAMTGCTDPTLPFCTTAGSFFISAMRALLKSFSGEEHEYIKEINIVYDLESMAVIPIKIGDRIIGIVYLADRRNDMVSSAMVEIMEKVCLQLGASIQRLRAEYDLKRAHDTLEQQVEERTSELKTANVQLEQKAVALREVIGQVEVEKNHFKDDVTANVSEVLLPLFNRMEADAGGVGSGLDKDSLKTYLKAVRHHLKELVTSFGRKITEQELRLTPREVEICSLIKSGLDSQEIADLLLISRQTIFKHRDRIRRKLKLNKSGINLTTYLQSL